MRREWFGSRGCNSQFEGLNSPLLNSKFPFRKTALFFAALAAIAILAPFARAQALRGTLVREAGRRLDHVLRTLAPKDVTIRSGRTTRRRRGTRNR